RGGARERVRPGGQYVPRRADAEDQRDGRQRLVLGAQPRERDDGGDDRRSAPEKDRAAVDELPAQLSAESRWAAAARDRVAPGRGRRGVGAGHVAAAVARAAAADRR